MKKRLLGIVYLFSALLSAIFAFIFSESLSFHIVPVIVIVALLLQALMLSAKDAVNTSLSSGNLSNTELYSLSLTIAYVTLCVAPLLFPFIVFGDLKMKTIVSCTAWLLTYFVGFVIFRIMYGSSIKNRMNIEEEELSEQKKREEQGLI